MRILFHVRTVLGILTLILEGCPYQKGTPNRAHVRVDLKARWTDEEIARLALSEARRSAADKPRFMNHSLSELHPGRSLEAIKGQRRNNSYRQRVLLTTS